MNKVGFYRKNVAALLMAMAVCAGCSKENNQVNVTGVSLNKTTLTLEIGAAESLTATVSPDNATNKSVEWNSSAPTVAAVDRDGLVTAMTAGETTITVTTTDGKKTDLCNVTVKKTPAAMTITSAKKSITLGLAGSGTLSIDWGDGSEPKTTSLSAFNQWFSPTQQFTHQYSDAADTHTIVMQGDGVTHMNCSENDIMELDVNKTATLEALFCHTNKLTTLDVVNNTLLNWLVCSYNQMTSLNVTKNTKLEKLECSKNKFTSLDVSQNTLLNHLVCFNNELTGIDTRNNPKLGLLHLNGNKVAGLDLTNNTALAYLDCGSNQLKNLDLSKNGGLTYLKCTENQLTELNMASLSMLKNLYCYDNKLTALDATNNTALMNLYCFNNQFTALKLNDLFGTLNTTDGKKTMYIGGNPGTADCDKSIAENKGWTVLTSN